MGRRFVSELWVFLFCSLLWKRCAAGAVLTVDPRWSTLFVGEDVTLTCGVEGEDSDWEYSFNKDNRLYLDYQTSKSYTFQITSTGDGGEYECVGRHKSSSHTEKSKTVFLTVAEKPKARLTSGNTTISVGDKVSLYCSVGNNDGWKFEVSGSTTIGTMGIHGSPGINRFEVSRGGIFRCRGQRETSDFLSGYSDDVTIRITLAIKPVITSQPSVSLIFIGEKFNLTCEVQGGGATDWWYYWRDSVSNLKWHEKLLQVTISEFHSERYACSARPRDDLYSSTWWSEAFRLSVLRPVLSVSPSWLIPGASVTLICHIEHPSAGLSFYWFKFVPHSQPGSNYEPLPGTSSGTTNNSFTVHGQTHTEAYACSAGRGDPVFYTANSEPKYVWTSDVHPSASLTVNPARVQHFTSESLSLTCERNSTEWKGIMSMTDNSLSGAFTRLTIKGSVQIKNEEPIKAVLFCQSGTAYGNAVNISTHSDGVILVSPVYPVPEGESVTLRCELKAGKVSSDVFFYKNDKIIQNDTGGEMKISAVSQSDEGFYKCQYKGTESAQSWMAVKLASRPKSSFPMWIIGLICGILLLIFLLLLFCCYKKTEDSCFKRSGSTHQSRTTDYPDNQLEDLSNTNNTPNQGDVTYSSIELVKVKNVKKKKKKPEEATIYSDLNTTSSKEDDVTYAQVFSNKSKAKGRKGKTTSAATQEMVYSEITHGQ